MGKEKPRRVAAQVRGLCISNEVIMTKRKPISKRLRFEVLNRDGFRCQYCGASADEAGLHIDHIIPVARGGTNAKWNLLTACQPCNSGKSDSEMNRVTVAEWMVTAMSYKFSYERGYPEMLIEYEFRSLPQFRATPISIYADRHGPELIAEIAQLTKGAILRQGETYRIWHELRSPVLETYLDFGSYDGAGDYGPLLGFFSNVEDMVAHKEDPREYRLLEALDLGPVSLLTWAQEASHA